MSDEAGLDDGMNSKITRRDLLNGCRVRVASLTVDNPEWLRLLIEAKARVPG